MSKFTQSVTKTFEFDGDKVTVVAKRIKRKHMMLVAPHSPEPGKNPTQEQNLAMLDALAGAILEYITEFIGLTDEEGEVLDFSVVVEEAYFHELLAEICAWWFEASQMSAAQVGKSKGRRRGGSGA